MKQRMQCQVFFEYFRAYPVFESRNHREKTVVVHRTENARNNGRKYDGGSRKKKQAERLFCLSTKKTDKGVNEMLADKRNSDIK